MDRFLAVTSLLSVALIFLVMFSLRRDHIRVEYSVSWLAAACVILFLSRWPGALVWLGRELGIDPPTALLTLLGGYLAGTGASLRRARGARRGDGIVDDGAE